MHVKREELCHKFIATEGQGNAKLVHTILLTVLPCIKHFLPRTDTYFAFIEVAPWGFKYYTALNLPLCFCQKKLPNQ